MVRLSGGVVAAALAALTMAESRLGRLGGVGDLRDEPGTCATDCNAGTSITGVLTLDRPSGSGTTINSAELTDLSFTVDDGPLQRKSFSFALGTWGEEPRYINSLEINASSVVSPNQGWAVAAALDGGEGLLGGSLGYFLDGACLDARCEAVEGTTAQASSFFVTVTASPSSPPPVPLPPALGLALAGVGALAGVWRIRRRR